LQQGPDDYDGQLVDEGPRLRLAEQALQNANVGRPQQSLELLQQEDGGHPGFEDLASPEGRNNFQQLVSAER